MADTVIVAIISFVGTLFGSWGGLRLMSYRLEQLEKRVEKHNNVIVRTYKLEENQAILAERIKTAEQKTADLEKEVKNK